MRWLVLVAILSGCGSSITDRAVTGTMECVGYCRMEVDKHRRETTTTVDGEVVETVETSGVGAGIEGGE